MTQAGNNCLSLCSPLDHVSSTVASLGLKALTVHWPSRMIALLGEISREVWEVEKGPLGGSIFFHSTSFTLFFSLPPSFFPFLSFFYIFVFTPHLSPTFHSLSVTSYTFSSALSRFPLLHFSLLVKVELFL